MRAFREDILLILVGREPQIPKETREREVRLLSLDRVVKRESAEKLAERAGWRPSLDTESAVIWPVEEQEMERDGEEGR